MMLEQRLWWHDDREPCIRRIRGFRCSFRMPVGLAGGGEHQPVRYTRGSIRVNFRLALD